MSRPQMKTINAKEWKPEVLTAPDGREYTPGSYSEHRQLLASGYAVKQAKPTPTPAAAEPVEDPAAPATTTSTPKRTPKAGEK